tara:strand:+ start:5875 stop:7290 length:1416 start_codon:yes stop_codon:yes gene_type:complete
MKIKPSLYFLGLSCFPISILSLINIFYCFYFNYTENLASYLILIALSLIIGFIFLSFGKKEYKSISIYEQIVLIFLIYILISFFISIPYYLSNYDISFLNSYFESISGLTGTGFSIFENINKIDDPLILWRSTSQWIGTFYFLIFLVLIFSNKQMNFKMIDLTFNFEKKINLSMNFIGVTNRIFFIYLSTTTLIFLFFLVSGLRLFDSLNLAMTVISSGGFLPTDSLNDIIRTNYQSLMLSLGFLISLLNFYLLYNLFLRRENLKEHKEDLYLILAILVLIIIFYLMNDFKIITVILTVLSSIGNSGISISPIPDNFSLYFLTLTIIGGCVLSSTSGIKFLRIYILVKGFLMEMYRLVQPNVIINNKIMFSDKKITNEIVKISFLVFILFFLSIFILSSILLVDFLDFENSFKLSILTLTNTVSSDIYGIEKIEYVNLLTFSKLSIILFMVIAKIELISIFILIQKFFIRN